MADPLNQITAVPPYVIQGERDWRPDDEQWKGPLSHPYGFEAYCVREPNSTRVRVYPTRGAAIPFMQECGYEI